MTLIRSFGYAMEGIWAATRGRNMRIYLAAVVVVMGMITYFGIRGIELAILLICIAAVLAVEILNTAIELVCDLIAQANGLDFPDSRIKLIKDLAAGGVLILAVIAAAVGVIIFLPHWF